MSEVSNRKPYVQKQDPNWWRNSRFFRFYMLREATSVPVLIYALLLIWGLCSLSQGVQAFHGWLELMQHPLMMLLHLLVIAAGLLHAFTWFSLTPKILVIRLGDFRVPDLWVKLGHWGGFLAATALVIGLAYAFLKGGLL